jgi:1,4-dihydroxy-2-naphthoyl-CoA hydrolase
MDPEMMQTGLAEALGFRFDVLTADRVALSWTVGPQHLQPYGIVHGGVYCAAIETAASVGAAVWLGDRGQVVGVANNTDFLRATRDGDLTATATPVHRGRSQQLWLVEVTRADGKLVARGQVRLQNLPAEGGLPPA